MSTLEGQSIGKYKLLERLGRGGMADVYKAHHPQLDRIVAVKVLHGYLVEGSGFLSRFQHEARSVAILRHAHILQVYDFDIDNDLYYMVMEYADGGTLQDAMVHFARAGHYMPIRQVLSLVGQVAEALDYAHQKGIIHRDIKPSNILLDSSGDAFLSDFGIARMMSGSTQFTVTGALIGTPTYMSPEQGRGDELTPVSDVYSLGIVLYELLTGGVPFSSNTTPLAIIHKHLHEPPPDPAARRPGLPPAACQVILKTLAKEPSDRYRSAVDMVNALRKALPARLFSALDAALPPAEKPTIEIVTRPSATRQVPSPEQETILPEAAQPSSADLSTERIEKAEIDSRQQPTIPFAQKTLEVFSPERPKEAETAPPSPPHVEEIPIPATVPLPAAALPARIPWIILLMGLLLFAGRGLVEFLVEWLNPFDYYPVLPVVEVSIGILGLFTGLWHWLTLRLFQVPVPWKTLFILAATWCASFLTIGVTTTLVGIETPQAWHLAFGLAGLLGGLGTALLILRTTTCLRPGQVVVWSGLSALWFYCGNLLTTLSEPLWEKTDPVIASPLKMGLADILVGILLAWTISRLVRPVPEPVPPIKRRLEYSLLALVFGWLVIRLGVEMAGFALFGERLAIKDSPDWLAVRGISLAVIGLLYGFSLWGILRCLSIPMHRAAIYALPLSWAAGYPLGILLASLLGVDDKWLRAACMVVGPALAGAFTAWLLYPTGRSWRQYLWIGLSFGLGNALGNLVFTTAWSGVGSMTTDLVYSLCTSLQGAVLALLGGTVLFSLLLPVKFKIRWVALTLAAAGFALGVLFQDLLALNLPESTGVRWWGFLPYVLWGSALVLMDRDWKKCLLYGVLVVLAVLAGRYLWVSIRDTLADWSNVSIFYATLGLMLGLFLSLGQRWQAAVLLIVTVILVHFLQAAIPYPQGENAWLYVVDMLHYALVGAIIFLAKDLPGMIPPRQDIPVSEL